MHEEASGGEAALALWEDPGWNHEGRQECSDDDGPAAAKPLRDIPNDGAADAGAGLHEDGCSSGGRVRHVLLGEHEGRVAVLTGVRVVVELCPVSEMLRRSLTPLTQVIRIMQ